MAEEQPEANTDNFDEKFDTKVDELLSQSAMKETPPDSSSESKPEGEGAKTDEPAGAEPEKTDQVKNVEADETLSPEDKISKIKELLGDDEKALDAYIKEKGYHNDPAWQKQRELIDRLKKEGETQSTLAEEDRAALEEFKTYRNSSEYIQTTMKAQGFTQEAIDKKLQDSGFDVQSKPQDDVDLVVKKLGVDLDSMTPEVKANTLANIQDVVKVAQIIVNDRLDKVLPKELKPLQEHIQSNEQTAAASKMMEGMKTTVTTEGVLDFDKDIEPELNKFLDSNPDASQQDLNEHFKSINHTLTIERYKAGASKEVRDEKKSLLRQNVPISKSPNSVPAKTGNFDKDSDAFFDALAA